MKSASRQQFLLLSVSTTVCLTSVKSSPSLMLFRRFLMILQRYSSINLFQYCFKLHCYTIRCNSDFFLSFNINFPFTNTPKAALAEEPPSVLYGIFYFSRFATNIPAIQTAQATAAKIRMQMKTSFHPFVSAIFPRSVILSVLPT